MLCAEPSPPAESFSCISSALSPGDASALSPISLMSSSAMVNWASVLTICSIRGPLDFHRRSTATSQERPRPTNNNNNKNGCVDPPSPLLKKIYISKNLLIGWRRLVNAGMMEP
ncbi:hypothetical protein GDO81_020288 [Engystomops pustulosus]|uniref:Uncharacterized protein n=1 Tax=Engystomops pustulosus TaxID=76066 RepID=A0AAV6ZMT7_ENGPU|nr:hypothetical protein GDO81_028770 [Engystomops pustulosus]KAG8549655.1 hypothetical protein GDO81_020288 [Engystomops pustulosus]